MKTTSCCDTAETVLVPNFPYALTHSPTSPHRPMYRRFLRHHTSLYPLFPPFLVHNHSTPFHPLPHTLLPFPSFFSQRLRNSPLLPLVFPLKCTHMAGTHFTPYILPLFFPLIPLSLITLSWFPYIPCTRSCIYPSPVSIITPYGIPLSRPFISHPIPVLYSTNKCIPL